MFKWLVNLIIKGYVEATAFKTTGGSSSQFVKGDGSLDGNNYALDSDLDNHGLQETTSINNTTDKDIIINSTSSGNLGFQRRINYNAGGWARSLARFNNEAITDTPDFQIGVNGGSSYNFAYLGFGSWSDDNTLKIYPDGTLRRGSFLIYDEGNLNMSSYVPNSITISAGTGLSGGGDLSVDRTISLSGSTQSDISNGVTAFGWGNFRDYGLGGATLVNDLDFNEIDKDSNFGVALNSQNGPVIGNQYSYINIGNQSSTGINTILAIDRSNDGDFFYRHRDSGSWQKVWTDQDFDIADYALNSDLSNNTIGLSNNTGGQIGIVSGLDLDTIDRSNHLIVTSPVNGASSNNMIVQTCRYSSGTAFQLGAEYTNDALYYRCKIGSAAYNSWLQVASRDWVNNQNFATESYVDNNGYATETFVEDNFAGSIADTVNTNGGSTLDLNSSSLGNFLTYALAASQNQPSASGTAGGGMINIAQLAVGNFQIFIPRDDEGNLQFRNNVGNWHRAINEDEFNTEIGIINTQIADINTELDDCAKVNENNTFTEDNEFTKPVKGVDAVNDDEFVTLGQMNGSGVIRPIHTITSGNYTYTSRDYTLIHKDTSSATNTINIPTASSSIGRIIRVIVWSKNKSLSQDFTTNFGSVRASGVDIGAFSPLLLQSDGIDWYQIN